MKRETFYIGKKCGTIAIVVNDGGGVLSCCGEEMEVLKPNTVDAAAEKHVPVIAIDGDVVTVTVGEVEHPMVEDHWIEWIYLVTKQGVQAKCLNPGDAPCAKFILADDEIIAAYAYCNKHGLWRSE